ncbi:MAG: 50S ribosomal protein L4 [Candidatus Paceibacterota bacterium]|jgi:large subunit ribosomal protein L4
MEAKVYNKEGKVSGTVALPEKIFGLAWNADLVNQVTLSMRSNARQGNANTKDRSEVSGGGKKPWKQKGTGRSRHGSTRSPIWVGGGIAHGPRSEKNYARSINKTMRNKALFIVLSAKLRDGEIIFVNDLGIKAPKTKDAQSFLANLTKNKELKKVAMKPGTGNKLFVATAKKEDDIVKSFRNIPKVKVEETRNLNPVELLNHRYLMIVNPEESLKTLEARV